MAVNIAPALCNGKLIHIDDLISKEIEYYCPSCLEIVIAKEKHQNGQTT